MKKLLLLLALVSIALLPIKVEAQETQEEVKTFPLFVEFVAPHIGKTTRAEFEKLMGEPVETFSAYDADFVVYYIKNSRENYKYTDVTCYYRESDNVLLSLSFIACYPDTHYWGIREMPGYMPSKDKERRDGRKQLVSWSRYAKGVGSQMYDSFTFYGEPYGTVAFFYNK